MLIEIILTDKIVLKINRFPSPIYPIIRRGTFKIKLTTPALSGDRTPMIIATPLMPLLKIVCGIRNILKENAMNSDPIIIPNNLYMLPIL
jgi:hypothetical protein